MKTDTEIDLVKYEITTRVQIRAIMVQIRTIRPIRPIRVQKNRKMKSMKEPGRYPDWSGF